jgi:NADH:ubiquinone oxidoreductase subunit F (NADH-binding)/(2Fe-2S) ferredoxin
MPSNSVAHNDALYGLPSKAIGLLTSYKNLLDTSESLKPLLDTRLNLRPAAGVAPAKRLILVCGGTGCHASESERIVANLQELIEADGCTDDVHASISGCFGFCEKGPIVKIFPDDVFYVQVKPDDVPEIFDTHIHGNQRVRRLLYEEPGAKPGLGRRIETQSAIPFYRKQERIALRNCGLINPEDIDECLAAGGYQALGKVLTEMTPEQVIDLMKRSGLRGRGGAGFPTGRKWEFARGYRGDEKFVICNADEGDPGAFMDRSIMEGDSNSVIEGMAIAAYAIGSRQGYVYIRAEYPLAVRRLEIALDQARAYGLLGKNILGTGFDFDVAIKLGAGAFVCGEETALIHSMQGERGEPRTKPPFPAEAGLWGKPTIVNNVETLANVPAIINRGADWYSAIGTKTSKGTKVFALAGQVNNVGLVEVPMGTTLREIIFEIGGGIKGGHQFKAAQTGGPSGGCIPEQFLDTPIDYESLGAIGSIMGSGGLIVMSEKDCMVNIAKFYLEFTMDESCGRCLPCRIGTKRLHEILTDITDGKGTEEDLVELRELSNTIIDTALCGLGQGAPNPILSTMKYFWKEYEAHVLDRRCPAGVCQKLLCYRILPEKCVGCTACARNCPVSCISGQVKQPHVIDATRCIKCGACMTRCKFKAIERG